MPIPAEFVPLLRDLVHQLVIGNYAHLEADGRAGRVTADQLREAIEHYGRTFIDVPDQAFQRGDIYAIRGKQATWRVDLPLWTVEEGESDLTLQVTVVGGPNDRRVSIDDLHML